MPNTVQALGLNTKLGKSAVNAKSDLVISSRKVTAKIEGASE